MIKEIFTSYRTLPLWVMLWMTVILVPINIATLLFWNLSQGWLIALLANLGMAFNLFPMINDRGFGKAMAIPHLIFWIPLCIVIVLQLPTLPASGYKTFLVALLIVNLISLVFDVPDALKWLKGNRGAHNSSH